MLRKCLIALFASLLALVLALGIGGVPGMIGPGILLGLVLAGLLFETFRYRPLSDRPPGGAFVATSERFVDPETGKLVVVHADAKTGARRYVAVGQTTDAP